MRGGRTRVAVGDVDGSPGGAAEEHADDALASVPGDAIIMVDDAEEDEGVHDDPLHWGSGDLLRLYDVHLWPLPLLPSTASEWRRAASVGE